MSMVAGWNGEFAKITGAGNDFVVVEDVDHRVDCDALRDLVPLVCDRHFGIGADGLILLRVEGSADVRWQFYNSDGSEAEMCGNGARCAARYVADRQLVEGNAFRLHTLAGIIDIDFLDGGRRFRCQLTPPQDHRGNYCIRTVKTEYLLSSINTGVPHAVLRVADIESFDLLNYAPEIRYHESYPQGTNVNAYETYGPDCIRVRTYERGVEGETMSCGTGSVAAAIVACLDDEEVSDSVRVITNGGELLIEFDRDLTRVSMTGDAQILFRGRIDAEMLAGRTRPEKEA